MEVEGVRLRNAEWCVAELVPAVGLGDTDAFEATVDLVGGTVEKGAESAMMSRRFAKTQEEAEGRMRNARLAPTLNFNVFDPVTGY